jgi:hypothetical protein
MHAFNRGSLDQDRRMSGHAQGRQRLDVLTTRTAANAAALERAITAQGGESLIVEMDLVLQARRPRRSRGGARATTIRGIRFTRV